MALQPELQWFAEHRLLHSHIGVITNIRADHEDVMGQGLDAIAIALANTIPTNGILVTGPDEYRLLSQNGCLSPDAAVHVTDASQLPPETFSGFSYEVFPQNIALALTVCALAGVSRDTALDGMRQARPDAGNLTLTMLDIAGSTVRVVNAFAANDPDSTALLYKRYVVSREGTTLVWLHGRPDRKLRSVQLCQALANLHDDLFLVSGDISFLEGRLRSCSVSRDRVITYTDDRTLHSLLASLPQPVTIFAAGNIHGLHSAIIPLENL
jgi:poly-gamma-glutamate synthase PgsB/CapB